MPVDEGLYDPPRDEEKVGQGPHDFRISDRIVGVRSTKQSVWHLLTPASFYGKRQKYLPICHPHKPHPPFRGELSAIVFLFCKNIFHCINAFIFCQSFGLNCVTVHSSTEFEVISARFVRKSRGLRREMPRKWHFCASRSVVTFTTCKGVNSNWQVCCFSPAHLP